MSWLIQCIKGKWRGAFIFGCLVLTTIPSSQAARYDEFPGNDIVVHYVHLTGRASVYENNDADLAHMREDYENCVKTHNLFKRPYVTVHPSDFPSIVSPEDIEIYYASNRTLTVTHRKHYSIDTTDCRIKVTPKHKIILLSAIGRCEINILENKAVGVCDDQEHDRAPDSTLSAVRSNAFDAAELNKVPAQMRQKMSADVKKMKLNPFGLTGENKLIAKYTCEVSYNKPLDTSFCVSNPPSPFLIPASASNGGRPGLMLEIISPQTQIIAQEVIFSMSVSKRLFMLPKGLRVFNHKSFGTYQ